MADHAAAELAPPGWYPDPNGSDRRRWWNGLAWAPHLEGDSTYPGTVPGVIVQPLLPTSTSVNPWQAWLMALLPLVSVAQVSLVDTRSYLRGVLAQAEGGSSIIAPAVLTQFALLQLVGWASMAATIVLAFLDWRALKNRGVVRPFNWAWSFLVPPLVYLIGRSVVLRRRVGRGSAPLWAWVIVSVAATVLTSMILLGAVQDVLVEYANEQVAVSAS